MKLSTLAASLLFASTQTSWAASNEPVQPNFKMPILPPLTDKTPRPKPFG